MTKLLSTKAAAQVLGVSEAFLERDRWAGATIPFVRVGSRSVRYVPSDLEKYIAKQREEPDDVEDEEEEEEPDERDEEDDDQDEDDEDEDEEEEEDKDDEDD